MIKFPERFHDFYIAGACFAQIILYDQFTGCFMSIDDDFFRFQMFDDLGCRYLTTPAGIVIRYFDTLPPKGK